MTGIDQHEATQRAEAFRRACASGTVLDDRTPLPITISIGFTVAEDDLDLARLMREADQALYAAKRTGRDRVVGARAAA